MVTTKSSPNLMLGSPQKDAEGKKKTLLVSVTPFGADTGTSRTATTINKKFPENRVLDIRPSIKNNVDIPVMGNKEKNQIQEKIIDMPLIQSNQLISMIGRPETLKSSSQPAQSETRASISMAEQEKDRDCQKSTTSNYNPKIIQSNYSSTNSDTIREMDSNANSNVTSRLQSRINEEKMADADLKKHTIEDESLTLESMDMYDPILVCQKSREDAGVPDGRADEDEIIEPVAHNLSSSCGLKITPLTASPISVPACPRRSFLHGETSVLDTIYPSQSSNSEPKLIDVKKVTSHNSPSYSTHKDIEEIDLERERQTTETNTTINADLSNLKKNSVSSEPEMRRRMAPKPPDTSSDDSASSIFARKPAPNIKSDCPVVREKEKRERATSCSPKFRTADKKSFNSSYSIINNQEVTDPVNSKRSISLSRYNPTPSPGPSLSGPVEEDIRKKNKPRFSLRRLLRMGGSRKDIDLIATGSFFESLENVPQTVQLKPRPEIIHPLELDGAAVEVLRYDKSIKNLNDQFNDRVDCKIDDSSRLTPNVIGLCYPIIL